MHWCCIPKTCAAAEIISGDLDESGAFGQWPEDFDDVILQISIRRTILNCWRDWNAEK